MSISCAYNKSDMHRYERVYLLVYVNIIVQLQTDMDVYICLYFSADMNKICVCLYLFIPAHIRLNRSLYLFIYSSNIWV